MGAKYAGGSYRELRRRAEVYKMPRHGLSRYPSHFRRKSRNYRILLPCLLVRDGSRTDYDFIKSGSKTTPLSNLDYPSSRYDDTGAARCFRCCCYPAMGICTVGNGDVSESNHSRNGILQMNNHAHLGDAFTATNKGTYFLMTNA